MANDDTPYDRIREMHRRGEDLAEQEDLETKAASFQESVRAAKARCAAGECDQPDCRVGPGCPFRRSARVLPS